METLAVSEIGRSLAVLLLGILALYVGGDRLIYGACRLAVLLGVSPLVVGLTVVALGTSTPELAVTVQAVLRKTADVGMGNIIGSCIFNSLVILGISALLQPLMVAARLIRYEVPVLIAVLGGLWVMGRQGRLLPEHGMVLLVILAVYLVWVVLQARRESPAFQSAVAETLVPKGSGFWTSTVAAVFFCLLGLVLLVLGSEWVVSSAVRLARALGVTELVVGLTIVAAGTSLPELATSAIAAVQRKADIAVGNVIGSNLLNILAVLAPVVASSSQGFALHQQLLHLDLPVALGVSVLLLPLFWSGARLDRLEGIALLVLFGLYLWVVAAVALKLPGSQTWINVYLLGILPAAFVLAWVWARFGSGIGAEKRRGPSSPAVAELVVGDANRQEG